MYNFVEVVFGNVTEDLLYNDNIPSSEAGVHHRLSAFDSVTVVSSVMHSGDYIISHNVIN